MSDTLVIESFKRRFRTYTKALLTQKCSTSLRHLTLSPSVSWFFWFHKINLHMKSVTVFSRLCFGHMLLLYTFIPLYYHQMFSLCLHYITLIPICDTPYTLFNCDPLEFRQKKFFASIRFILKLIYYTFWSLMAIIIFVYNNCQNYFLIQSLNKKKKQYRFSNGRSFIIFLFDNMSTARWPILLVL